MRFLPLPARPLRLAIALGGALALLSACDASRAYIVMDDQKREQLLAARDSAESEAPRPIEAKKPGNTAVVATKADYRPYEFLDENGQAQGLDVDILKAVAKDQGFNVVFSPLSPSSGLNSLLATLGPGGGADVVARALPSNPERAEKYGQTQAYSLSARGAMWKDPKARVKGPGDLARRRVAAPEGDTADSLERMGVKMIAPVKTLYAAIRLMAAGDADVVVAGKAALDGYASANPDDGWTVIELKGQETPLSFLTRKDNPELLARLNAGLMNIKRSGEWLEIHKKWLGRFYEADAYAERFPLSPQEASAANGRGGAKPGA